MDGGVWIPVDSVWRWSKRCAPGCQSPARFVYPADAEAYLPWRGSAVCAEPGRCAAEVCAEGGRRVLYIYRAEEGGVWRAAFASAKDAEAALAALKRCIPHAVEIVAAVWLGR